MNVLSSSPSHCGPYQYECWCKFCEDNYLTGRHRSLESVQTCRSYICFRNTLTPRHPRSNIGSLWPCRRNNFPTTILLGKIIIWAINFANNRPVAVAALVLQNNGINTALIPIIVMLWTEKVIRSPIHRPFANKSPLPLCYPLTDSSRQKEGNARRLVFSCRSMLNLWRMMFLPLLGVVQKLKWTRKSTA